MQLIEKEVDKARGRISLVEKDLAKTMTKTDFQDEQRRAILDTV